MPSLFRRKSLPFLRTAKDGTLKQEREPVPDLPPPVPEKDLPYVPLSVPVTPRNSTPRNAAGIFRRVSTVLRSGSKTTKLSSSTSSHYGAPLSNIAIPDRRRETTLDEDSPDSIDEIRRPSGLGDAVSISSQRSLPPTSPYGQEEDPFEVKGQGAIARTASTPNLVAAFRETRHSVDLRELTIPGLAKSAPKNTVASVPVLPQEVLEIVLGFLPHQSIAKAALVSKVHASAARNVLYRSLDFETIHPSRVEALIQTLSSRRKVTDVMTAFNCRSWPPCFDPRPDGFLSNPTGAKFAFALQHMDSLTKLTLPAFDPDLLRHHSAFGLTSLSFNSRTMTPDDTTAFLSWLDGQTNITSLSLPDLLDEPSHQIQTSQSSNTVSFHMLSVDTDSNTLQPPRIPFLTPTSSPNVTPLSTPQSGHFPRSSSPQPSVSSQSASPTLLPCLTHLHAPPSLVEALAPNRPLKRAFINIDTTLYGGLRPGKLMGAINGVTKLGIRFGESVDRRTVEKVLGSAGAVLGSRPSEDGHDPEEEMTGLEELEVHVFFSDPGSDDVLYKILHTALPRYRSLHTLKLVRLRSTLTERRRPSFNISSRPSIPTPYSPTPTKSSSLGTNESRTKQLSPKSFSSSSTVSSKSSAASFMTADDRRIVDSPPSSPTPSSLMDDWEEAALTEHEQLNVKLWLKQAPSLKEITLLSRATWRVEDDLTGNLLLSPVSPGF